MEQPVILLFGVGLIRSNYQLAPLPAHAPTITRRMPTLSDTRRSICGRTQNLYISAVPNGPQAGGLRRKSPI